MSSRRLFVAGEEVTILDREMARGLRADDDVLGVVAYDQGHPDYSVTVSVGRPGRQHDVAVDPDYLEVVRCSQPS